MKIWALLTVLWALVASFAYSSVDVGPINQKATATTDGYLSATDWVSFNAAAGCGGSPCPPATRTINTTAPLAGGGNLSADRTFSIAMPQFSGLAGNASGAATNTNTSLLGDVKASAVSQTATLTIAAPGVVTATGHGLSLGDKLYFTTTGALPTGVVASTTYYAAPVDANTFRLSTSLANAQALVYITTTGSQSGVHTLFTGGYKLKSIDSLSVFELGLTGSGHTLTLQYGGTPSVDYTWKYPTTAPATGQYLAVDTSGSPSMQFNWATPPGGTWVLAPVVCIIVGGNVNFDDYSDTGNCSSAAGGVAYGYGTAGGGQFADGDRILLVNSATGTAADGIWTAQPGAAVRATDANTAAKLNAGAVVELNDANGSVYNHTIWVQTANLVTIDVTAQTWSLLQTRDFNNNVSANSFLKGYTTTVTAAGTKTLTVADTELQFLTGSSTHIVKLPVTSTLVLGQRYTVRNNSSGTVTIQSSGAGTVQTMLGNSVATVTCILTSGTTAASWSVEYVADKTAVAQGGTGLASGTSGGVLAYTASGTLASSAALTAAAVVVGGGAGVVPTVVTNNGTATNKFLTQSSSATPAWLTIASGDLPNHSAALLTSGTVAVAQGGTNLASGTSGGVLAYTASGTLASSAALTANGVVYGGGAGVVPAATAAGTTSQVFIGGTPPSFGNVPAAALPAIGQTTAGVDSGIQTRVGSSTNDTASAGNVGEMFTISRVRSSSTALTSGATLNVGSTTSITLTAGDWDIRALVGFQPNGTAAITELDVAVSATSATLPSAPALGVPTSGELYLVESDAAAVPGNGHDLTVVFPSYQVQVANGQTKQLYLVANATFSGAAATLNAYGWMQARRMR